MKKKKTIKLLRITSAVSIISAAFCICYRVKELIRKKKEAERERKNDQNVIYESIWSLEERMAKTDDDIKDINERIMFINKEKCLE